MIYLDCNFIFSLYIIRQNSIVFHERNIFLLTRYEVALRIQFESGKCAKNADQNNSEYGHFLRSVIHPPPTASAVQTLSKL